MQLEHPWPWIHAFEMMPVVRRHGKLSAVLRVVVPVWPRRIFHPGRGAVGAHSGFEAIRAGSVGACPCHRHRDVHELAPANSAPARFRGDDYGVYRTAPGAVE